MKTFLNSDQDYTRYRDYEARLPEYEQMGGLRSAMQDAGVPLTDQQAIDLVEAMHKARLESGISDRWEGRAVLTQIEQPGMAERLARDWEGLQETMSGPVDRVLDPAQREAFDRQQAQVLQGLTMGIRFAEASLNRGDE